ncbi:hypothetical protein BKP45_20590 [Anaerobacillus alkalidiazotrophicus]|uniref:Core-binding (CB) domain-containing protein n=1 Tax=Anaerobacillus alkalidiazotrophicus TaxID=472963 RepID=A0A1S2LZY5_9BACI|nr:hypothetical protein [Anaerobacillus alkalidiazotrophicus]OIJ17956.1 hypothetical protein BKP45_20590 [Anaerobacillus alkalidiazotrophicus]
MTIKYQTNVDYHSLCKELGVTIDELIQLVKNKDKFTARKCEKVSFVQLIDEYSQNLRKLQSLNRRSDKTLVTYVNILERVKSFVIQNYRELSITDINEDLIFKILEKSTPRKGDKLPINTINKLYGNNKKSFGFRV